MTGKTVELLTRYVPDQTADECQWAASTNSMSNPEVPRQ
jgi:hypothetical protein